MRISQTIKYKRFWQTNSQIGREILKHLTKKHIYINNLNGREFKTNDNKQKQHSLKPSTTGSRGKGIDNKEIHTRDIYIGPSKNPWRCIKWVVSFPILLFYHAYMYVQITVLYICSTFNNKHVYQCIIVNKNM